MKQPHSRFSWRNDPDVPTFSDTGPRAVMDAHCAICARGARWIARNDKKGEFGIIPVQSELGRALMIHHGIDPEDPLSWLYLEDGHGYESVEAMIRTGQSMGITMFQGRYLDAVLQQIARTRNPPSPRAVRR